MKRLARLSLCLSSCTLQEGFVQADQHQLRCAFSYLRVEAWGKHTHMIAAPSHQNSHHLLVFADNCC